MNIEIIPVFALSGPQRRLFKCAAKCGHIAHFNKRLPDVHLAVEGTIRIIGFIPFGYFHVITQLAIIIIFSSVVDIGSNIGI